MTRRDEAFDTLTVLLTEMQRELATRQWPADSLRDAAYGFRQRLAAAIFAYRDACREESQHTWERRPTA